MKKNFPLLSLMFFISWGCEDLIDELIGPKVNLWGEDYSIKNTIEIVLVTHLDDVIEHALESKPSAINWNEADFIKNSQNNVGSSYDNIVKH